MDKQTSFDDALGALTNLQQKLCEPIDFASITQEVNLLQYIDAMEQSYKQFIKDVLK